jgi:hypothetical protein
MKARMASAVVKFQDIPNIGPAMVEDLILIGIKRPADLKGNDAFALYQKLCKETRTHHDPCVLDTFIAAVDFMNGASPRPWWHYTKGRKKQFPSI